MNKVFLIGRLTRNPEIRYTQSTNIMVANFNLAVERRFAKQGEERKTDFIPIVAWNSLAKFSENYLHQGIKVLIEGRMEIRQWQDKDGNNRYSTEVIAENIEFCESKKQENNSGNFEQAMSNANMEFTTTSVDNVSDNLSLNSDDLPF